MFIGGLLIGMRPARALSAGLLLGVAFQSVNLVITFILETIGPVGQKLVERTGLRLVAFDLGWAPAAAMSWAWTWAAFALVIGIAVNAVMLYFKWTETLNVDLWNLWHLAWTGAIIDFATGSFALALLWCVVHVTMQLKSADLTRAQVRKLTQVPGVSVSHPMLFTIIWQYPIYSLINRIPGLGRLQASPEKVRAKVGIFAENHVLGFIVGALIAAAAREPVGTLLTTGVMSAAALTLFPMVSELFMRALSPIADATTEFTKKRFPGRRFYVGIDWLVLAGSATIWTVAILLVPFLVMMAIFLPGNEVLPYGSLIFISGVVGAVILAQGDMIKSFLITLVSAPVYFYAGTWLAPYMTKLADTTNVVDVPSDVSLVSWLNQDTPVTTWLMVEVPRMIFEGRWHLGLPLLVTGILLYCWYYRGMTKAAQEVDCEISRGI
jgi:PTS system galactitol-specific IIC component